MKDRAGLTHKIRIVKKGDRYTAEKRVFFFFWEPAIYHDKWQQYYETAESCEKDVTRLYRVKEVVKVLN